ncbi:hypothetical protein VNO80_15566 [Phaseolus coccineus]|uniref:Uncharacterized protein n=1 Tax=Phaseolus coccineus TaxID=3886 RepID=A0AAN9R1X8_PHACN
MMLYPWSKALNLRRKNWSYGFLHNYAVQIDALFYMEQMEPAKVERGAKVERRVLRVSQTERQRDTGKRKEVWVEKKGNKTFIDVVKGEVQQEFRKGVSSSETYVEETTFSSKSCEEDVMSRFEEDFRSKGEEDGGEVVGVDYHPDQDHAFGCSSAFTHAELAKAVVDVECTNAKWEHYYSSAHERMMKTQFQKGRVSAPTQTIEGESRLGSTQCEEDRIAGRGVSSLDNLVTESVLLPMTKADGCQGDSEEGGAQEGETLEKMMPQMIGKEGVNAGNGPFSPPRCRNLKALLEFGDSFTHLRLSARINSRLSQAGAPSHHRDVHG